MTNHFDEVVSLFEALGFEKKHAPVTDTGKRDVRSFRMKHPEGYHVDVSANQAPSSEKKYEAYDIFMAHGFTNTRGNGTLDTKSAREATLVSPSGFKLALVQHIKNHD